MLGLMHSHNNRLAIVFVNPVWVHVEFVFANYIPNLHKQFAMAGIKMLFAVAYQASVEA
ncbi:hypothetical protein C3B55_00476 [Candidatus Pseudomonas adelgestsugas]|uniref:Uncharacterized protein n=1 Tax=Candidatus Pseudomonas adelgestsugas TaxID=1302376 RepID=A0ABX5R8H4_9PSED|nr:hypothetical protein C3B55_00476 [Candidatus Pseudomonas adelgestsugas]